jgi:hypothetical protein
MQDQRFVLLVVQEHVLSAQLHFHITVDFIEAPILLAGKSEILLRQALHIQLVRTINFTAPELRNILSPAVKFPDKAPIEVSP